MSPRFVSWFRCPLQSFRFARTIASDAPSVVSSPAAELTFLYDGACPLCLREVRFLRRRDHHHRIHFVDVDADDYDPSLWAGISYRAAMTRIHAIRNDGSVLTDVAVFRECYRLIGMGWLYAPTTWPVLSGWVDRFYGLWAAQRLRLTGRCELNSLCDCRKQSTV